MSTVVLVGTLDTKGGEFAFARDRILSSRLVDKVLLIDVGVRSTHDTLPRADIDSKEVVLAANIEYEKFKNLSKGEALKVMSCGLEHVLLDLHAKGNLHGVMGIGGGCGSTLLAPPFQKLPVGLPKLLVSTVAGVGNARTYIGCTDMTLMHSVTDLSGKINPINRQIISNASVGIAAMTADYAANQMQNLISTNIVTAIQRTKPLIAISMIGITQGCALAAEAQLDKLGYETVSFHCIGVGGDTMEELIMSGTIDGVLDITVVEVMNSMILGSLGAGSPHRLEAAGRLGVPQVVSLGGLDLINFGPWSAIPVEYHTRANYENNANCICLRTSQDECTRVGKLIATKLNNSRGSTTLFIPHGGLSVLSGTGGMLEDTAVDECLFKSLRAHIDSKVVDLIERDENINDPRFAQAMVDALHEKLKHKLFSVDKENN